MGLRGVERAPWRVRKRRAVAWNLCTERPIMSDRQAQEFWDQMWYWEEYETYPGEQADDPHLVMILGAQVQAAGTAGQQPPPDLMQRYDHCVGRVLDRLTNLLPRT